MPISPLGSKFNKLNTKIFLERNALENVNNEFLAILFALIKFVKPDDLISFLNELVILDTSPCLFYYADLDEITNTFEETHVFVQA